MEGEERREGPGERRTAPGERRAGAGDRRLGFRRGQGRYDRRDKDPPPEIVSLRGATTERRQSVPIRRMGQEERRLGDERRQGPADRRAPVSATAARRPRSRKAQP